MRSGNCAGFFEVFSRLICGLLMLLFLQNCENTVGDSKPNGLKPNTISEGKMSPDLIADCDRSRITQDDSLFLDFDLFNLRPICPAKQASDYLIKVKSDSEGGWLISPRTSKTNIGSIRIKEQAGVGYWKDTLPKLRHWPYIKIAAYEARPDYVVRFIYQKMLAPDNRMELEEISIVTPKLEIFELFGIYPRGLKFYERPAEKDIRFIATNSLDISDPKRIILRQRCKKGNCANASSRFQFRPKTEQPPPLSAFWYWLLFDRITILSYF